jgi:hypothetical protein
LAITVADVDSNLNALTLTGSSSNASLVPNANIVFGGAEANRTVVVTPVSGQSGSAIISLIVSDGALNTTTSFTVTVNPAVLNCPTNYVLVPGNSALGTTDFCVMKYEAKNVNGVATSQASANPWVGIKRGANSTTADGAWKACKSLGPNYDLISNSQWQTIARNIESVASNWSNNSSSDANFINRGVDGAISAASTDNDPCPGGTAANCSDNTHADFDKKRTHSLSNNQIIWDISSNVWEWVQDDVSVSPGTSKNVSQLTLSNEDMLKWGPAGDYISKEANSNFGGLGAASIEAPLGGVLRGGDGGDQRGIFATYLNVTNNGFNGGNTGFRCVMNSASSFATAPTNLPAAALVLDANSIGGSNDTSVDQWLDINGKTTATLGASPSLVTNAMNGRKAVAFNGSNQALQVASNDSPISGSTEFTIAVVFKAAAAGAGGSANWYVNSGIVDGEEGGGTHDWGLSWSSESKLAAGVGNPDSTHYSGVLETTDTHIAIYRWNGANGNVSINVDGTASSSTFTVNAVRNSHPLKIGSINGEGGKYFNGLIAQIRIYQTALSDTHVSELGTWLAGLYGGTFTAPN